MQYGLDAYPRELGGFGTRVAGSGGADAHPTRLGGGPRDRHRGRADQGRNRCGRAHSSLGARLSARRSDAGDGTSGAPPHRVERRGDLGAAFRHSGGLCRGPGRIARRGARPRLHVEPPRLCRLFGARRCRCFDRSGAGDANGRLSQGRHLPPGPESGWRRPFRRTPRLQSRRQAVHHAWRALQIRSRARSLNPSRQDRAHQSGRFGAGGQPLSRAEGCPARDLVLWSSQCARCGHSSQDGRALGERIWPHGWRRAQHPESRIELWLARGELGQAL